MVLITIMTSACRDSADNSTPTGNQQANEISQPAEDDNTTSDQSGTNEENASVTDNLSPDSISFSFSLDGIMYELPISRREFEVHGWSKDPSGWTDDRVMENEFSRVSNYEMVNGDSKINVVFGNLDGSPVNTAEPGAQIIGVQLTDFGIEPIEADLVFPGGVTFGTTSEDVMASYGKPDLLDGTAESGYLSYDGTGGSILQVSIADGRVVGLYMVHSP